MEKFCAFVENRTPEPLDIPKIPIIYHNDPFLRARKRLGPQVDLKKSSARKKSRRPPTSTEVMIGRVEVERAQEVAQEEEEAEAPIQKSKRLVKGKAKVLVPASPNRKDLAKLDEVPRKRRKFLEASTVAAAKATLPQPSSELTIPLEANAQLVLITPEPIVEEVAPEVQEALLEVQSPTLMIQGVLGELDSAGEAVDAPGLAEEEEEGSSSIPEKDDAEDRKVASVVQMFDSPLKRPVAPAAVNPSLELVQAPPRDEVIVMVEESVPGGCRGLRGAWARRGGAYYSCPGDD